MLDLGPEGGFLALPAKGQRQQEGTSRGLFREASDGRAPPKPTPEVPRTLRNTPLTCKGLSRPGWRKIARARELAIGGTARNEGRRKGARAATGAVNPTGAAVNCSLASSGS